MLTIPIGTLAYIVTKAREFDAEVPSVNEDSGSNPSDDADRDVLEASADNPSRQELADAIDGLGDPERIELLAPTWLGRGDYSKEEWGEAHADARRIHDESKPCTWSARRCLPTISKRGCPSWAIRSKNSRSAECSS